MSGGESIGGGVSERVRLLSRAGQDATVVAGHNPLDQFKPRPVSRYFRFDWNYALNVARLPVLPTASIIISLMPILAGVMQWLSVYIANVWLLWTASVFFLVGYFILKLRAPPFIQEYQFYSQYEGRGHSHRWIVWQFYTNLDSLSGWEDIVRETKEKLISLRVATAGSILRSVASLHFLSRHGRS
jgi:hypothetical protein